MGPLSMLVKLPLAPVTGVVKLGEVLRDQAEREQRDPASIRRQLEEAEEARAAGEISPEEEARTEEQALNRLRPDGGAAPTRRRQRR